jgi:peptidyl-tRNA hydrolase, PTH1 family
VWVIIGLGNPGTRYVRTRHNVGFRVVDRLAARWRVDVEREAHRALLGEARRDGERVLLVKPQTFMNASGESVASLQRFYRFDASHIVAVHDDVDLAAGRIKVRTGGGPGGHRGIESLIGALGDGSFVRIKVGVGRPPADWDTADWVLAAPRGDEAAAAEASEERAADAVELLLTEGPARAMNRINQKEAPHGGSPL